MSSWERWRVCMTCNNTFDEDTPWKRGVECLAEHNVLPATHFINLKIKKTGMSQEQADAWFGGCRTDQLKEWYTENIKKKARGARRRRKEC